MIKNKKFRHPPKLVFFLLTYTTLIGYSTTIIYSDSENVSHKYKNIDHSCKFALRKHNNTGTIFYLRQKFLFQAKVILLKKILETYNNNTLHIIVITGAAFQPGAKTVIPGKVIGKFSIRIVPNQEPKEVENLVFNYINKKVRT